MLSIPQSTASSAPATPPVMPASAPAAPLTLRSASPTSDFVPRYHGLKQVGGELPTQAEVWPRRGGLRNPDEPDAFYDIPFELVRHHSERQLWVWPRQLIYFFSDVHADAEAFRRCLCASGGVALTGPGHRDFELTDEGREAVFVIGGDCFDKGPANLPLLETLKHLYDIGAEVDLLAGNHDLRTLIGVVCAGRREVELMHLFVRMGRKTVPLLREIYDRYLKGKRRSGAKTPSDKALKEMLFPDEAWYREFPERARGFIPEKKLRKEIIRIREKSVQFEERCRELGMTLGMVWRATQECREQLLGKRGDFAWFFQRMRLARRAGSYLFVHAGVDDEVAGWLRHEGVEGLNARFQEAMAQEAYFNLYNGNLGNTFRTKYRDFDLPFSADGVRDMNRAGIYTIVHGHRNIRHGQRMRLRAGLVNLECDASVDRNTRRIEDIPGPGGAATIFRPDGTVLAVSTDHPYVKVFDPASICNALTVV